MGCGSSRIQDKDVLERCRARKRFILLAIENRYAFAAAHVAYVQALRNVGISLRKFAEAEMKLMSSQSNPPPMTSELAIMPLNSPSVSVSATPSPLHSVSPIRVGSSKSFDFSDSHSSASYAVQPQMNYMRSKGTQPITVQEGKTGTLESFTSAPQSRVDHDPSPPPSFHKTEAPPPQSSGGFDWSSLNPFSHLDDQFYFSRHKEISHSPERSFLELKQVREDEGIPDLEDGDHGEQSLEEEIEQVRLQKRNSGVDSVDPHIKESAIGGHSAFKSSTSSQDPSVESMAQFASETVVEDNTAMHAEQENEAGAKMAADKTDGMGNDKEYKEEKAIPENERAIVVSTPGERNLLDSMTDIESWFLRAYDSGKEVSRMLEANKEYYHSRVTEMEGRSWTSRINIPFRICCFSDSGLPESHEAFSRVPNLKSWQRTTSQSSSSKSPYISISKGEIDDSSSDFLEDLCMISGSHLSTLERLYAWEKKLYDEVKAEESLRSEYVEKCVELRHLEAREKDPQVIDRTRATVKSLHSQIMVAIHAVESISKRIQRLRDEELQPQLLELIQGMIRMWEVMLECHQSQYQIIKQSNSIGCCAVNGMSSDLYRQATVDLGNELDNWHLSFSNWIGAQKAYVQALYGWHQKCILYPAAPSKRRPVSISPREYGAPLVVIICTYWSQALEPKQKNAADDTATEGDYEGKLSDITAKVFEAFKNLTENVQQVWSQWDGHQHQQRRKEDSIGRLKSGMQYTLNKKKLNTSKAGSSMVDSRNSLNLHRKPEEEEKTRLLQQTNDSFLQKGLEDLFASLTTFASAYKDKLEDVTLQVKK